MNSDESKNQEESTFRVVDKRQFLENGTESPADAAAETRPRYPSFVEELMFKVTETERRFAERVKQVDQEIARSKARLEAEYERKLALSKQDLLLPYLEVLDNLERALQAVSAERNDDFVQGLQLTASLFHAKLRSQSVERIEVIGKPFDPNLSQAVGMVAVEEPAQDGMVVEETPAGLPDGRKPVAPGPGTRRPAPVEDRQPAPATTIFSSIPHFSLLSRSMSAYQ